MSYEIRLITVHTNDVSYKLGPLREMFCNTQCAATAPVRDTCEEFGNFSALSVEEQGQGGSQIPAKNPIKLSQVRLPYGPASIESDFDEVLAAPYIVGRAIEAEQEGCDALVIDCFGDPALHAVREVVRIPVIGAGEAAMHLAASLGHTFGIVTVADSVRRIIGEHLKVSLLDGRCRSIRAVDIPVTDLHLDREKLDKALSQECLEAIVADGSDVVVLGCTGFFGTSEKINAFLSSMGVNGVPVIDPLPAAIATAIAVLDAEITHSRRAYPAPPSKRRTGYALPERLPPDQPLHFSRDGHSND